MTKDNHICPLAHTDHDGDIMCGMVPIPCLAFDCERWTYKKENDMPALEQWGSNWQSQIGFNFNKFFEKSDEVSLAHEVAELRKEIAALRAELAPVPSLIVTGRQAIDEFKRLVKGK